MNQWYEDDQFWTTFYDCMFHEERFRDARTEIESLMNLLEVERGHVLDLACGPGRHLEPLAQHFAQVTGLDASSVLLKKAQQLCTDRKLDVELVQADMREYERAATFDLIACLWSSFGYFDTMAEDFEVLERCCENLKPQGSLIIDIVGKEQIIRQLEPAHVREFSETRLLLERPCLEDDMSRLSNEWILIDGATARKRYWSQNLYTAVELQGMLGQAGFGAVEVYGGYAGEAYDLEAERLVVVATKL